MFEQFADDVNRTYIVNKSFNEMMNVFSIEKNQKERNIDSNVNIAVMIYLFAFKVFLSHWETYLKRTWKSDKDYFQLFKDITSQEYNNCMDYRITYRLRNYIQHCNMPINHIHGRLVDGQKLVSAYVNRDIIINDFDEWKKEELDFLKSSSEKIDIIPIFQNSYDALHRIQEKLLRYRENNDFLLHCEEALEMRKKYCNNSLGNLILVEYFNKDGVPINDTEVGEWISFHISLYLGLSSPNSSHCT